MTNALALSGRPDLTLAESDLSLDAIEAFAAALGGRQALQHALEVASGSPEVDKIVSLLDDPAYEGRQLRWICQQAGITVADLFAAYKKALLVLAHLEANRVVTSQLVKVVEDVMHRAQPHDIPCEACRGTGQTLAPLVKDQIATGSVVCAACRGTGRTAVLPDLDRQKLALELGRLVTKSGGLTVHQTQNTVAASASSSSAAAGPNALLDLQRVVGGILTPKRRAPTPVPPVPPGEPPHGEASE